MKIAISSITGFLVGCLLVLYLIYPDYRKPLIEWQGSWDETGEYKICLRIITGTDGMIIYYKEVICLPIT